MNQKMWEVKMRFFIVSCSCRVAVVRLMMMWRKAPHVFASWVRKIYCNLGGQFVQKPGSKSSLPALCLLTVVKLTTAVRMEIIASTVQYSCSQVEVVVLHINSCSRYNMGMEMILYLQVKIHYKYCNKIATIHCRIFTGAVRASNHMGARSANFCVIVIKRFKLQPTCCSWPR